MPIEHIDDFNEAVAIIEGGVYPLSVRHLKAAIEMIEHRESQILTLRKLLEETLPFVRGNPSGDVSITNRITSTLAITWPEKDIVT